MESNELVRYKSGISQAYWCDTSDTLAKFQEALIAFDNNGPQTLSWFDQLFEGGILLPGGEDNSVQISWKSAILSGVWKPNTRAHTILNNIIHPIIVVV